MRATGLFVIGLLAVLVVAVTWRTARGPASHPAVQPPNVQHPTAPQSNPSPQSAPQLVSVQQQSPAAPTAQGAGTPAGAAQEKETEQRLGPFSISGSDYTVVLHKKKRQPGGSQETGDTVVTMEIRDAAGAIQYQRKFPYPLEANDTFSDAWFVDAFALIGVNGTGLLVGYSLDSEPSAPQPESDGWWQVFGMVDGKLKSFSAPIYVVGSLVDEDSAAKTHTYRSAGPLGPGADALQFRVWTGHFRLVFPVRVDWTEGKLTPAQPCEQVPPSGPYQACQYKVLPEEDRRVGDLTFVSLCKSPNEKCDQPARVLVKPDSKVELLATQVGTYWTEGIASGPSGKLMRPLNAMDDAGSISLAPNSALWLKVRIDAKEGWMHTEEDFDALGLPHEM